MTTHGEKVRATMARRKAEGLPVGRPKKGDTSREANNFSLFFQKHKPKPWLCCFCGKVVKEIKRGYSVVHHLDHNHDNKDLSNLEAAHKKCHDKHHLKGREITWGDKISEAKKRQWADGVYDEMVARRKEGAQ